MEPFASIIAEGERSAEEWDAAGSVVLPLGADVDSLMHTALADFSHAGDADLGEELARFFPPDVAASAIEHNALAILVWDASDRILAANAAFSRLTGYRAADFGRWNLRLLAATRHGADFFAGIMAAVSKAGSWQGDFWVRTRNGRDVACLLGLSAFGGPGGDTHYVAVLADLTAQRAAFEESLRVAHQDPLTGLANRSLLTDRMRQALSTARRSGEGVSVLFVDLDQFKHINDTFGRSGGDEVLRTTARRLQGCVREQDTVARLGSDEFVVLLPGVADARQAVTVVRKIGRELFQPIEMNGQPCKLTASVGISLFPEDGVDPQSLIQHAETAMFGAKARGRNSYAFYRRQMTEDAQRRLLMESSLLRAIERNEFSLVFQPQVDIATGAVSGAETLLRWNHPELGPIGPDRFIGLAEETGLIRPIGSWVLRSVCSLLTAWRSEGMSPLRLAVNVSPQQISRRKHTDQLLTILSNAWEPGGGMELELEITESSLQTSQDSLVSAKLLKSTGVTLAIDDFGTGYSSLMTLRELPVDRLKLDRSFMQEVPDDPGKARLAAAAIAMGRTLGLRVLAEGLETEAQLDYLRSQRCDEAQGYLIGRPMSPAEFRALATRSRTVAPAP